MCVCNCHTSDRNETCVTNGFCSSMVEVFVYQFSVLQATKHNMFYIDVQVKIFNYHHFGQLLNLRLVFNLVGFLMDIVAKFGNQKSKTTCILNQCTSSVQSVDAKKKNTLILPTIVIFGNLHPCFTSNYGGLFNRYQNYQACNTCLLQPFTLQRTQAENSRTLVLSTGTRAKVLGTVWMEGNPQTKASSS